MSRSNEHAGVETFKLQAKMLQVKSAKGDVNGLQGWVNNEINLMMIGSIHALALFFVFSAWISFPDYYSVMITIAYFLFNLLFWVIKLRKYKELKALRQKQVNDLNNSNPSLQVNGSNRFPI